MDKGGFRTIMRKESYSALDAVVYCKHCKYWDKGYTEECNNIDSVCFHNGCCKPDWFCADGEMKDDA